MSSTGHVELTKEQLKKLDIEIQGFGALIKADDFDKYLIFRGAMRANGMLVRDEFGGATIYEKVMDEIEQWKKWLGKIQYAKRMELKALATMEGQI